MQDGVNKSKHQSQEKVEVEVKTVNLSGQKRNN